MKRIGAIVSYILTLMVGVPLILAAGCALIAFIYWLMIFGPSEMWAALTTAIRVGFNHEWKFAEVLLVLLVAYLVLRKRNPTGA